MRLLEEPSLMCGSLSLLRSFLLRECAWSKTTYKKSLKIRFAPASSHEM
jgi:hypothetical protein